MRHRTVPAIGPVENIEDRLETVFELAAHSIHIIETDRPFANVSAIEFAIQCHLNAKTVVSQCVTAHTGFELFHRLRLRSVILGHDRSPAELGLDGHPTEGLHKHRGSHRCDEGSKVFGTFGSMNRRFVDDVGLYQVLGRIPLSTEDKPHRGKTTCHFDDFTAAFAIINTPEKTDGVDLWCYYRR